MTHPLQSSNPTIKLMAEAVTRAQVELLKKELKKMGYKRLIIGAPPFWKNGPSNCISAMPYLEQNWNFWDLFRNEKFSMLKTGCGNRFEGGVQTQLSVTLPPDLYGDYKL